MDCLEGTRVLPVVSALVGVRTCFICSMGPLRPCMHCMEPACGHGMHATLTWVSMAPHAAGPERMSSMRMTCDLMHFCRWSALGTRRWMWTREA